MKEIFAKIAKEWAEPLAEAAVIIIALFVLLWPIKILGTSMEPTVNNGDWVFGSRLAAGLSKPKSGDIVLFSVSDVKGQLIKRVIAVSGDTVEIKDGFVFVNGEQLDEYYLDGVTEGTYSETIKEGYFYALGDNRATSTDSRDFGQVPVKQIKSKILLRFYPLNQVRMYFLNMDSGINIDVTIEDEDENVEESRISSNVFIDGVQVRFDGTPAQIIDGRTFVPARAVFEAMGFTVSFDSDGVAASIKNDDTDISVRIGDSFLTVNGEMIASVAPPTIIDGQFMIPLRSVAEATGAIVEWDAESKTAYITTVEQ